MIYLPIHLGLVYGKCRYCKYAMDPMGNMKFTGPESIPQVHLSNRLHAELLCGHLFRNIGGLGESQVAFKGLGSTPSCQTFWKNYTSRFEKYEEDKMLF